MSEFVSQHYLVAVLRSNDDAITEAIYAHLDRVRAFVTPWAGNVPPARSIELLIEGRIYDATITELFGDLGGVTNMLICKVQLEMSVGVCAIFRDAVQDVPWTLSTMFAIARSLRDFYDLPHSERLAILGQ